MGIFYTKKSYRVIREREYDFTSLLLQGATGFVGGERFANIAIEA